MHEKGKTVSLFFYKTTDFKRVELDLLGKINTPYNVKITISEKPGMEEAAEMQIYLTKKLAEHPVPHLLLLSMISIPFSAGQPTGPILSIATKGMVVMVNNATRFAAGFPLRTGKQGKGTAYGKRMERGEKAWLPKTDGHLLLWDGGCGRDPAAVLCFFCGRAAGGPLPARTAGLVQG